jgi:hypothetical protein
MAGGEPDDALFAQVLAAWPPYAGLRRAICARGVAPASGVVADYVRTHDAPGEPYAVCRFNRNKADGLVQRYG